MSKARRPASKSTTGASRKASTPRRRKTTEGKPAGAGAKAELSPLDPEYERPESELPPISFPDSGEYEFSQAAAQRRRIRIRNEIGFGVLLAIVGLGVLVATHSPAFLALAMICAVAIVAFEMTISTLE